jgi:mannose-6-phosphate isomerase-like protein (cupin superfamily)
VKRHASLIPLSHDHHHGLVQARRLRRAAGEDTGARAAAAEEFLAFFAAETLGHFRQEEELLFPLLVAGGEPAPELLVQALVQHQRIHALVAGLAADPSPAALEALGEALEAHIRLEERELFPLLEELVPQALSGLDLAAPGAPAEPVVDLLAPAGRGPAWGTASDDLNATLLVWSAGEGPPEHVNDERDVFLLVLGGSAALDLDGRAHELRAGTAVLIAKGVVRRLVAGPEGVRYVSVHRRRPPLAISPRA